MQEEIKVLLPKIPNSLNRTECTFTINQLKCKKIAVVYYKLHLWDINGTELISTDDCYYIGERTVVDEDWGSYHDTFTIKQEILDILKYLQIEIRFILVDDENPIYFSEIMLQNGEFTDFHSTNEKMKEASIGFINNSYANLYKNDDEDYLQIIRSDRVSFTTNKLTKAKGTVIIPHLVGEPRTDNPTNIFMEYLNQKEQTTNIKMI